MSVRILRRFDPRSCSSWLLPPLLAIVVVAAAMAVVTFTVSCFAFHLAAVNGGVVDDSRIESFADAAGRTLGPAFDLLAVLLTARWIVGERADVGWPTTAVFALLVAGLGATVGHLFGDAPAAGDVMFAAVLVAVAVVGARLGLRRRAQRERRERFCAALGGYRTALAVAEAAMEYLRPFGAIAIAPPTSTPGPGQFVCHLDRDTRLVAPHRSRAARELAAIAPAMLVHVSRLELHQQGVRAGALRERERLAGDIHDTVAQQLAGVSTHLEAASGALATSRGDGLDHVAAAATATRSALAELRGLVWALRPPDRRVPLREALVQQAERIAGEARVALHWTTSADPGRLGVDHELCLLRSLQEALRNAVRHAGARRIEVGLVADDVGVRLEVADDGGGGAADASAPVSPDGGYGLQAMAERAQRLGGELTITSVAGRGTRVVVRVPRGNGGEGA